MKYKCIRTSQEDMSCYCAPCVVEISTGCPKPTNCLFCGDKCNWQPLVEEKPETDYYGRVICQEDCPARFSYDNEIHCNANLRGFPDKWDREKDIYIALCRIPIAVKLVKT